MKKLLMVLTALALLSLLAAACVAPGGDVLNPSNTSSPGPSARGFLQVMVTDAPAAEEVTSIMVTVSAVEVHTAAARQEQEQEQEQEQLQSQEQTNKDKGAGKPEEDHGKGNKSGSESTPTSTPTATPTQSVMAEATATASPTPETEEQGWSALDVLEEKASFDLLVVKGLEELLAVAELEAGNYTQIRMTIDRVQVRLGEGELQDATVPSGKLKFVQPFQIAAGQTTTLLFDFDAEKSVNVTGSGTIMVKPVIKLTVSKPEPTPQAIKITTPSLPNGSVDVAYGPVTLAAAGGTAPFTWSVSGGSLPAGLALDPATGIISGTPTTAGDCTFTVIAADSSTPAKSASASFTMTIGAKGAMIIATTSLPDGATGTAYSAAVALISGTAPVAWTVAAGNLPDGLAIDPATGAIAGTPTKAGKYQFTLQASDASATPQTDTQELSIRINKS